VLIRGRQRLESRLHSRGFSRETCLATGAMARPLLQKLSPPIIERTVQLVLKWHTFCMPVDGTGASTIHSLAQGVITSMFWNSIKAATIPALVATCLVGSVVLGQQGQAPGARPGGPASTASHPPAKKMTKNDPALRARLTEHIRDMLTRKYDLELPKDVSLEQFLKTIRQVTIDSDANSPENFHGIPIYVDPEGLDYAGMTLQSRLTVEPGKTTLLNTLEKSLKSVKLWYEVGDGFLKIDSRVGIVESRLKRVEDKLDRVIKALEHKEKLR
jgi:hypothetical protein